MRRHVSTFQRFAGSARGRFARPADAGAWHVPGARHEPGAWRNLRAWHEPGAWRNLRAWRDLRVWHIPGAWHYLGSPGHDSRGRSRSESGPLAARGQALVEFALVLPIFMVLFLGIVEFMFLFNAQLSLNYATRDAALVAAEAGNNANADCLILQQIDKDLGAPTDDARVIEVHVFSATETGAQLSPPAEQTYARGGSTTCGGITVPYSVGTSAYPYNVRCSDLDRTSCSAGTTSPTNTGVDIIGVRIDYGYRYITPLGSAFRLIGGGTPLWGGTGTTMFAQNAMRMEPIL